MIEVEQTKLEGVKIITPRVFGDDRGYFFESFNARDAAQAGLPERFVQDNESCSSYGVLRGLHLQCPQWQGKLVRVVAGEVFDVAVDIRRESATYGEWIGVSLSADNRRQLYVPEGFAHGFCVTSETAVVLYKCTALYKPEDEHCILWNDPDIGIRWPVDRPVLSPKDAQGVALRDLELV